MPQPSDDSRRDPRLDASDARDPLANRAAVLAARPHDLADVRLLESLDDDAG